MTETIEKQALRLVEEELKSTANPSPKQNQDNVVSSNAPPVGVQTPASPGELGYVDQLIQQKQEMVELSKKLEEQRAAIIKEANALIMGGKGQVPVQMPPKSPTEALDEEISSFFKGTGLDPLKGFKK